MKVKALIHKSYIVEVEEMGQYKVGDKYQVGELWFEVVEL